MLPLRRAPGVKVADLPWLGKPHRFWYRFCLGCLALFLTYALFTARSGLFATPAETAAAVVWSLAGWGGLCVLLAWFSNRRGGLAARAQRDRLDPRVFAGGAALAAGLLGLNLLAVAPGGVSVDSAVQWTQACTGVFSNWHPVFHTLLLRLCAGIVPDYSFAVAVQCAVFSLCLGYLLATLAAWGLARRWVMLAAGLLVASPIVGNTLMYLWKDNAMTIGALVLCAQAVNLYYSRGDWLARPRNAVAFGLALAFTTLVRHNALLFTLPLLACVLLTLRAQLRGALTATAVLLAALALVLGPLYAALGVRYPNNGLEESIGLPMTVVCDIRKLNPGALDAETLAFTDAMADADGWAAYPLHRYNAVKFGPTRGLIAHTTLSRIFRMAAGAALADPRTAFLAVNGVTDLVWGLADEGSANVTVRNTGDLPSVPRQEGRLSRLGAALWAAVTAPLAWLPLAWYVGNLGVPLAAMLVLALRALRRNGLRVLLLCVPTLLYSLGTLCVLCGEDARFFAFSPLLCTLSLFVLTRDVGAAPETVGKKDTP